MTTRFRTFMAGMFGAMVLGALLAMPVAAQEEIAADHMNAAKRAVLASKSADQFDALLAIMAERVQTTFIQSNPAITQDITEATEKVALNLANRRPELDKVIREIWARRFSIEELNTISEFYESEIGKKLAEKSAEIAALSVGASKQWSDVISVEMINKVRDELEKRGHKFDN